MKPLLKGVLHLHSTYSDGEFTLAELRDLFRVHPEWFAPWAGTLFRFHTVEYPAPRDVLSGEGAHWRGGRWGSRASASPHAIAIVVIVDETTLMTVPPAMRPRVNSAGMVQMPARGSEKSTERIDVRTL